MQLRPGLDAMTVFRHDDVEDQSGKDDTTCRNDDNECMASSDSSANNGIIRVLRRLLGAAPGLVAFMNK